MTSPPTPTLLITVGSTLFPLLTDTILSQPILDLLPRLRISKLIVQYGRAELSLGHLPQLSLKSKTGSGKMKLGSGLEIEVMRFTDDFEGLIQKSDAVISHAGSGSILTVLRANPRKPLLVIPNTTLMDNHQIQLAENLNQQGYLLVSSPEGLVDAIPLLLGDEGRGLRRFPALQERAFPSIVDELAGFGRA